VGDKDWTEKEHLAFKTVMRHLWWAMATGAVPVPFLDMAALMAVQLKMLSGISKVYGVPFKESRGKAFIGSLIGVIVPQSLSWGAFGTLLKLIPGLGALAGGPAMVIFSGASTYALGKVFIQHFSSGGTFLGFNPEQVRDYFRAQFEEGRKIVSRTEQKTENPA